MENVISQHEHGVTLDMGYGLKVTYSFPSITSFNENEPISSVKDFMYFYYDLEVRKGRKVVFKTSVSDYPIVDVLGKLIDSIIEKDTILLDSFEHFGRTYTDYYTRVKKSNFTNQEYFAILEKNVREVSDGNETTSEKRYTLTFGEHPNMFRKYSNKHIFSNDIAFRDLAEEQLLDFKLLSEKFIEFAIKNHNKELAAYLSSEENE